MSDQNNEDMSILSRFPVVVILGATGTGKSKLAIDLAKRFKGEIISTDSMQVYKGFDILTNKVTPEEMQLIPHHLMSIIEPEVKFDVVGFRNRAIPIVNSVLETGKSPFLVGGTNYYIESLLWRVLISNSVTKSEGAVKRKLSTPESSRYKGDNDILNFLAACSGNYEDHEVIKWSSKELYDALIEIDIERADRLHPNDKRKILRSLQVYFQTGVKHSELISHQLQNPDLKSSNPTTSSTETNYGALGGPLRYPNSICFWIQVPKEVLKKRIEARVDQMVSNGLRAEIDAYDYNKLKDPYSGELDFTKGVLQSIGLKEFKSYLLLPPQEKITKREFLFNEGIDQLKLITYQYAKKQVRWIKQRFLMSNRRQVPPVYWLDGESTLESDWARNVTEIASEILEAHILGKNEGVGIVKDRLVPCNESMDDLIIRTCNVCGRSFVGNNQWDMHLKSKRHKKTQQVLKEKEKVTA